MREQYRQGCVGKKAQDRMEKYQFLTKKLQDFCNKGKKFCFLHSKLCHFSKQNKSCPNIKLEEKCNLDYHLKVTVPRSHNQNQNGPNREHGDRLKDKNKNQDRKISMKLWWKSKQIPPRGKSNLFYQMWSGRSWKCYWRI